MALVNDRPVLGGNNSSEVRVHLGGRIESGPYKELGNLQKEFGPTRGGNAQPADYYEDDKKAAIVAAEPNITLYANYRAVDVQMEGQVIRGVVVKQIESGQELSLRAPLFSDCTGDGTAEYGHAFEHLIVQEVMAYMYYSEAMKGMSFWHTQNHVYEVDLVVGNAEVAIEIKSSDNVTTSHLKGLKAFGEEHPDCKLIVVSLEAAQHSKRCRGESASAAASIRCNTGFSAKLPYDMD